jgi:hypothetical protein
MARMSKTIELSPRIERMCWTVFGAVLVCGLLLYSAVLGAMRMASRPAEPQAIVVLMPANFGQTGVDPVRSQVSAPSNFAEGSDVAAN